MSIVINLIQALFLLTVLLVLVSYAMWKYELGNRTSDATAHYEKTGARDLVLGIVGEIGAVWVALILYPIGYLMRGGSSAILAPGGRPVIFCHGYMHNRSAFLFIIHHLRKAGMNNLIAPNFRPVSGSISDFAAQLAAAVNLAIQRTGSEKVDLVGHSMGGLIIRFYIEHLGGSSHVSRAVLLGAPVLGTKMAVLSPFKTAQQFRLDSPLVAELNASHSSTNSVNYISIWSDFDNMIIPPENAKMPAPSENIMVRGVGHVALLFSRQVITQLKNTLLKGSAV